MYKNASNKIKIELYKKKTASLTIQKIRKLSRKTREYKMFSLTRKPGDNTQYGTIGCCGTKLTKLVQALTESHRWFCLQGAYSVRYKESGRAGITKQCSVGAFTKFTDLRF